MKYYIKRSDVSDIEGPLSVEQINQRLRDKLLDLNSTGAPAVENDGRQVASTSNVWINVIYIPGVTGLFPNQDSKRNSLLVKLAVTVFVVVLVMFLGYIFLMEAFKGIQ